MSVICRYAARIMKTLVNYTKNHEAEIIWRLYRPCYIRAFKGTAVVDLHLFVDFSAYVLHLDAADILENKRIQGTSSATTDDYIQRGEFRMLNAYLCIYARMYDAFSMLDGGSKGRTTRPSERNDEDRRISLKEWKTRFNLVKNYGFEVLKNVTPTNCQVGASYGRWYKLWVLIIIH
jgi:hypothetical protein